jgi:hypothetical protein
MIVETLNRLEPESEGLLRDISAHISDEMLEEIAAADYGQDMEQHFAALKQIRDTGLFPTEMYWFPGEVLELYRNSWIENMEMRQGRFEFEAWARAFCCAALLRATREPWNYGDGISTGYTTIRLIHSLRALPVDLTPQVVKFFAWLLANSEPEGVDGQVCAYGIALLWFALHRNPPVEDEALISLVKWITRRANELYSEFVFDAGQPPLRMGVGNPPPSPWAEVGSAIFDLDLSGRTPELRAAVQEIGLELAE